MKKILFIFALFVSGVSVDCSQEACCNDYSVVIKDGLTTVTLNKKFNLSQTDGLNLHVILSKNVACFSIKYFMVEALHQVFFLKDINIKMTNKFGISVTSDLSVNGKHYCNKDDAIKALLKVFLETANNTICLEKKARMYEIVAQSEYKRLASVCADKEEKTLLLQKETCTHLLAADAYKQAYICSRSFTKFVFKKQKTMLMRAGYEYERASVSCDTKEMSCSFIVKSIILFEKILGLEDVLTGGRSICNISRQRHLRDVRYINIIETDLNVRDICIIVDKMQGLRNKIRKLLYGKI